MAGWTDDLGECGRCGERRVVTIAIPAGIDDLVSSCCLGCGGTSWLRHGRPATHEEIIRAATRLWRAPLTM